jgi:hypothetical protein
VAKRRTSGFPRVSCLIEGCPSTTTTAETLVDARWLETNSGEGYFLCSRHWRLVPRYMKRRRRVLIKLWRKYNPSGCFWDYPPGSPERLKILRIEKLIRLTWERCVQIAAGQLVVSNAELGEIDPAVAAELRGLGLL